MIVKKPKWVIRSRKSKRDTQCSSQKKKDTDVKSITQKTKDRAARTSLKTGDVGGPAPHVTTVDLVMKHERTGL